MPPFPPSADRNSSSIAAPQRGSLLKFLLLVFALSAPLWLLGAMTGLQLFEGLPVSALMAFCPLIAGVIVTYRENKTEGTRELLKRSFDYRRIKQKIWYVPILFLMPAMMFLSYELMRLKGLPLPSPRFPILAAMALFVVFFIAAIGEEVGWSGYAIDRVQSRWNALQASILLGLVWAVWHLVPLVQAHRSPTWIAWHCLNTVATRVILVWLYNNTGKSVFATILYHAMLNVSYFMFPNFGSHYDPRVAALIIPSVAVIVTAVWGPQTLARYSASPGGR